MRRIVTSATFFSLFYFNLFKPSQDISNVNMRTELVEMSIIMRAYVYSICKSMKTFDCMIKQPIR